MGLRINGCLNILLFFFLGIDLYMHSLRVVSKTYCIYTSNAGHPALHLSNLSIGQCDPCYSSCAPYEGLFDNDKP